MNIVPNTLWLLFTASSFHQWETKRSRNESIPVVCMSSMYSTSLFACARPWLSSAQLNNAKWSIHRWAILINFQLIDVTRSNDPIKNYCFHPFQWKLSEILFHHFRILCPWDFTWNGTIIDKTSEASSDWTQNSAQLCNHCISFHSLWHNQRQKNKYTHRKKEIISALRSLYPPTQKTEFTFHSAFSAWTQKDEQSRSKKMANINGKIFVYFSLSSSIMWTTSNIKLSGNTKAFNVW